MRFDMEPNNKGLTRKAMDDSITEIALTGLILAGIREAISIFDNMGTLGGIIFAVYIVAVVGKNYLSNKQI